LSKRSFVVAWTTVTLYCMAYPMDYSRRLQSVQNVAARLATDTRWHDITPVLRQLHWLPLRQRIRFKLVAWVRVPVTCWSSAAVRCRRLQSSVAHWPSSSLCWHLNLSFPEQTLGSGTEVSQTLVQKYGTVCRLHSDSPA